MNHARLNKRNRARFHNPDVSILSMNCIGGVLAHDLGIRFNSPTVNLYMRAEDFIRFCENNIGKTVERTVIDQEYSDCTPKHIAQKVIDYLEIK